MLPKSLISVVTLVLLSIAEIRSYEQNDLYFADLFQGDIILSESQKKQIKGKSGLRIKKWPRPHFIPYVISSNFNKMQKDTIMRGIKEFNAAKTCVQLVQRKSKPYLVNYVQFVKEGTGCASALGMQGNGAQNITLPYRKCFNRGSVLHQIMHAVGLEHEHTSLARDWYIRIVWENVREDCKQGMKLIPWSHNIISNEDYKYDYESVMHYRSTVCSKNGGYTIVANDKNVDQERLGGEKLTAQDIQKISALYQCPEKED